MESPENSTIKSVAMVNAIAKLSFLALLSPIVGLALEIVIAWRFGASAIIDAFRISSLILVFGNQLFLGQMLPHVVIPLVSEYRAKGLEIQGWRLGLSLAFLLGLVSLFFCLWVWFYPGELASILAPGIDTKKGDLLLFTRSFSLVFVLLSWSGVINALLNAYRVFWLLPVCQVLNNIFMILIILLSPIEWGSRSMVLGIVAGPTIMFILHLFFLFKLAKSLKISFLTSIRLGPSEGIFKALNLAGPIIGMILIGQWNIIIYNRALSMMPEGTLANFGFAWKLLLIAGILPASLATVIFPEFSEAQARNNLTDFSKLVAKAIRMTLLLTIPLGAVLFMIRFSLISFIFERGAMSSSAIAETGHLFGILLALAPAGALTVILHKVSYSLQDTKSPAIAAFFSAILLTLVMPYAAKLGGENGVAWSLNVVTCLSTLGLLVYLIWRYRIIRSKEIVRYFGLLVLLSTGIVLSCIVIKNLFGPQLPVVFRKGLSELSLNTVISLIVGYSLSQLLGIKESSEILNLIRGQYNKIIFNIRRL